MQFVSRASVLGSRVDCRDIEL